VFGGVPDFGPVHLAVKRKRGRGDYVRWQRARPMELWQMDILGGMMLADARLMRLHRGFI
jgi:hypothetical protein